MTALALLAGFALGMLGAAGHLAVLALRVRLCCRGQRASSAAALPLGLACPALAVLGAAQIAPEAALAALPGIAALRTVVLARMGEGPT